MANAGALFTTEEAGTIREGHFIVINNRGCKVYEFINTPKHRRHGPTVGFVAYDIFNRTRHDIPPVASSANYNVRNRLAQPNQGSQLAKGKRLVATVVSSIGMEQIVISPCCDAKVEAPVEEISRKPGLSITTNKASRSTGHMRQWRAYVHKTFIALILDLLKTRLDLIHKQASDHIVLVNAYASHVRKLKLEISKQLRMSDDMAQNFSELGLKPTYRSTLFESDGPVDEELKTQKLKDKIFTVNELLIKAKKNEAFASLIDAKLTLKSLHFLVMRLIGEWINAEEPWKHIFHVVTDRMHLATMKVWFKIRPVEGGAFIEVKAVEEFTFLNSTHVYVLRQPESAKFQNTYLDKLAENETTDAQNTKSENKAFVNKDLMALWRVNLNGKVNGAVETCLDHFIVMLSECVAFTEVQLNELEMVNCGLASHFVSPKDIMEFNHLDFIVNGIFTDVILFMPIPPAPVALAGQQVAPKILAAHTAWIKGSTEIVGLMLMTMDLDIHQNLENLHAHEMLLDLKTLFAHLGKTINELHAILKLHEQTLAKNNAPALHTIRAGKVQKVNKHKKLQPQVAARGQNHRKGKNKLVYALKPKIPPPPKREDLAKDLICHECGETGH
nr:hypothetical protein [Tanacetum cinerariifolium]